MITIRHGANVIHYFSHLIMAHKGGDTHVINGTIKLEVVFDFMIIRTWQVAEIDFQCCFA